MSWVQEIGGTDVDTDRYSLHIYYDRDPSVPARIDITCRACKAETGDSDPFHSVVWSAKDLQLTHALRSVVRHELSRHPQPKER